MKRITVIIGLLSLSAALAPLSVLARYMHPEYRQCMQQAVDVREAAMIDSLRIYNDEIEDALEERRARYYESWIQDDDRDQRDIQREADRDYRDRSRDARDEQRRRDREIRDDFNDLEDICRDIRKDRDNDDDNDGGSGDRCFSSAQCRPGFRCSTEDGDCQSACPPGAEICFHVCAGRCILNPI